MRTRREHQVDIAIQMSGIAASVVGVAVLTDRALDRGEPAALIAALVYGGTLIAMFVCSTLYNMATVPERRALLRVLDHAAIFLLIAGTYTPLCVMVTHVSWGTEILVWVWSLAVVGIVLRLVVRRHMEVVMIALYLLMGWTIVIDLGAVVTHLSPDAAFLLTLGGLIYTAGVPIHRATSVPFHDAIWHGCVFTAAVCHYVAILLTLSRPG